ncbi:MAG: hypothetical protein HY271_02595 [Deltaproteobacteria bacterium]|nr:hypothetical protein [Deltaproteobacteria bacterium]
MKDRSFYYEIFLISFAVIVLEISYTRVFSFKLFYYFTYLIIGVALLGIGSGGVLTAVLPCLRAMGSARLIPGTALAAGTLICLGYLAIARIQFTSSDLPYRFVEDVKLLTICTALFLPFLLAGIAIATIFTAAPDRIPTLYFADLLGAGLGCALCVPLLEILTPPGCVFLSGLVFFLAALRLARAHLRTALWCAVPIAGVLLVGVLLPRVLLDPVPDALKPMSPQRLRGSTFVFSRWNPVFRIDVQQTEPGVPEQYIINHDGMWGSTLHHFNGDVSTLTRFDSDNRSYPFAVLPPSPKVLIIGAAGGHEILAALYKAASHITAVELNPVTLSLLTDHFADYTGHIATNDRVTLVNAEGRSFLKRDDTKYDLIWFVAPDSYAAMNAATSGAYVLSESYLYTTEMIRESLSHLTADGIICMVFGEYDFEGRPNRTARYLGSARVAFEEMGIPDFKRHVMVVTSPSLFLESQTLLKKRPFTADDIARLRQATTRIQGSSIRYAWDQPLSGHVIETVITADDGDLARWYRTYPYDVRPVTDDSPFFWHFARFRDAIRGTALKTVSWDIEDATGERVLMVLLTVVIVFATVFLLLPFLAIRETWAKIPYKAPAAVYFAALGMGFMFFEIGLIQKLTLYLGYPTYSLTVTLFALFVFTGLGSLASPRYTQDRMRALKFLLPSLVLLMLFYQFGLNWVVDRSIGANLAVRIGVAVACLAPLGVCLGAFMPLGLATVAATTDHKTEYIAWAWAVNGFFSVISSILATMLSMSLGFTILLLLAVVVYLIGAAALQAIPEPVGHAAHRERQSSPSLAR